MKANKAIGLDKISARLLRDAAGIIAPPLTYIVNSSLKLGKFPSHWKCARVTALFKQGDRTNTDNYRPISVLPTVSKVIERAAHTQLYAFLESHQLLVRNQFGFRRGRSTPLALTQFTDEMSHLLDLKKAFDTVDHTILIHKLKALGVSGTSLAWFQSYLTSRFQRTTIGQATSCNRRVSVGVPQGSILGPLLFSIYINDLPTCLKHTSVTLFADDTALYCSAKSSTDLQQMLNEDLANVAEWLNDHKLTLNVAKSKFMIGSSQRLKALGPFSLQICDEFLDKADCYYYLGVIINETLTWSDHVDYISTKVNQRLSILRRIKHLLPIHTRELYVKSMILPLLDYSDIVWGDKHNKTLMAKVQLLQNKAAKLILNKAKHSEAINELDWLVLSERRRQHRLSFVFKCMHGLIDWNFNFTHLREIHPYNTRHKDNVSMPKSRCQWGQQRLTYQAIQEWNALPVSIRNSNSLDLFKKLFVNYFIQFLYIVNFILGFYCDCLFLNFLYLITF